MLIYVNVLSVHLTPPVRVTQQRPLEGEPAVQGPPLLIPGRPAACHCHCHCHGGKAASQVQPQVATPRIKIQQT